MCLMPEIMTALRNVWWVLLASVYGSPSNLPLGDGGSQGPVDLCLQSEERIEGEKHLPKPGPNKTHPPWRESRPVCVKVPLILHGPMVTFSKFYHQFSVPKEGYHWQLSFKIIMNSELYLGSLRVHDTTETTPSKLTQRKSKICTPTLTWTFPHTCAHSRDKQWTLWGLM